MEVDHTHPFVKMIRMREAIPLLPPIRLHDVDRGFTFFFLLLYFELGLVTLHGKRAVTDQ